MSIGDNLLITLYITLRKNARYFVLFFKQKGEFIGIRRFFVELVGLLLKNIRIRLSALGHFMQK